MSRVFLNNNAINQKGTPLLYTDILSKRPQYGINGRLFFSTDSQQIFEDTGTSWLLLADATGSVSGYVPYVGATTNLNLGLFNITATSLITSGGTSSQFVKGNGTLDSTTYVSLTAISGTSPIQYNNTTGVISILQSNTSQSGYLSSTDWNTFNNKASLTAFSATTPLSYNNSTGAFTISQATGSTNGYLSSTDWTTFNSKQSPLSGTGFVKISGTTISYDNSTYLTTTTAGTTYVPYTGASSSVNLGTNGFASGPITTSGQLTNTNGSAVFIGTASNTVQAASSPFLYLQGAGTSYTTLQQGVNKFDIWQYNSGTGLFANTFSIDYTGAATFSSSVAATSGTFSGNVSIVNTSASATFILNKANVVAGQSAQLNFLDNSTNKWALGAFNIGSAGASDFSLYNYGTASNNFTIAYATGAASFFSTVTAGGSMYFVNTGGVFASGGNLNGLSANSTTSTVSLLTNGTSRVTISSTGNLLVGSTTDNGKKLQVNGTTTTTAFAASGATYTVSATVSEQYYHVFTGAVGQTLTLLSPSSNNLQYVIINNSANTLTVAAAASTNIINTVGSSVSTITLIANQRVFLIADGNNKYYQIF